MKPGTTTKARAFTLIELLVIIAVLLFLAAALMPATSGPRKSSTALCMSHQKQIALAIVMWSSDHNDKFPWQFSTNNDGTAEYISSGDAALHFHAVTNYLKGAPFIFHCPTDRERAPAATQTSLDDTNLSYFAAMDVGATASSSLLTGDRHLAGDGKPVKPGLFLYSTNLLINWTHELHESSSATRGVLSFADGHVEPSPGNHLNSTFRNEQLATNRLAVP